VVGWVGGAVRAWWVLCSGQVGWHRKVLQLQYIDLLRGQRGGRFSDTGKVPLAAPSLGQGPHNGTRINSSRTSSATARRDVSLEIYILPLSHIYLYTHCSSFHSVSYFLLYTLIIQLKYKNIVKHFIFQLFFPHTSHQYSKNVKYVCCLKVVKITRVKMYIKYFTIWHIHLLYLHIEFISLSVYITVLYHILLRIYSEIE